jgi:hypothetical protein
VVGNLALDYRITTTYEFKQLGKIGFIGKLVRLKGILN